MFTNRKKKRFIYSLAGLFGLCSAVWLTLFFTNVGSAPINYSQKQEDRNLTPAISLNDEQLIKRESDLTKNALEKVGDISNTAPNNGSGRCSVRCNSALSMLDGDLELDDDTFNNLESYSQEIATFLLNNESRRNHYIQIALTTTDGDKRGFLTGIFKRLPYQQKNDIGTTFIDSQNWQVRADGVELIADKDTSNIPVANTLLDIFSTEDNPYVKGAILSHLKHNPKLQGDTIILQQLDSAIYNETDTSVRVAAFKAKVHLSQQKHHILPDALQALRTSDPELQFASLTAIDQILKHQDEFNQNGVYIDMSSIKSEFQIIQNLTVYDDNDRYDRLIKEANSIYSRYFKS